MREADAGSDHKLLLAKVRLKIAKVKKGKLTECVLRSVS